MLLNLKLVVEFFCRDGEIGIHVRFRGVCRKRRGGSSPLRGTKYIVFELTDRYNFTSKQFICMEASPSGILGNIPVFAGLIVLLEHTLTQKYNCDYKIVEVLQ